MSHRTLLGSVGILKSIHSSVIRDSHLYVPLCLLSGKEEEVDRLGYLIIADRLGSTQHMMEASILICASSAYSKMVFVIALVDCLLTLTTLDLFKCKISLPSLEPG